MKMFFNKFIKLFVIIIVYLTICSAKTLHLQAFTKLNAYVRVENAIDGGVKYSVNRAGIAILSVKLDSTIKANLITITKIENGFIVNGIDNNNNNNELLPIKFEIMDEQINSSIIMVSRTMPKSEVNRDCIDLNSSQMSWFGGPQQKYQYWPIEKLTFNNYSYVSKEADNCGITERYWLNSYGVYVYVDAETPLYLDQNINGNELCFIAAQQLPYNRESNEFTFNYYIGVSRNNARQAHLQAVDRFLMKPTDFPDERMVQYPIWSTWARYKRDVNESIVMEFANEILTNNFTNSQYELDDDWEQCYGALTFNTVKFPNIKQLTDTLKEMGFRVTLWIHPFINKGCEPWYTYAKTNGYLVQDYDQNTDTQWWNSDTGEAAYIDFTNPAAAKWFRTRLETLQNDAGIDSFKFDAGESSWSPTNPKLTGSLHQHPSLITTDYVRTVANFGPLVEVRSGQGTQDLPIFLRMIDKDSEWNWNNGLPTLITTLLQLNMVGYPFVLPDMIGGNGYNDHPPNKEMFIRWLQANVFMPSLQFSYVPWDYDLETITLSQQLTQLHTEYAPEIIKRFKLAVLNGDPVNPPLWWIEPNDRVAQQINDQFLLGEDIISAPILQAGQTSRDIYLPNGNWEDKNTNIVYVGPKWLMDYPAPLNVLPYFVRVKN